MCPEFMGQCSVLFSVSFKNSMYLSNIRCICLKFWYEYSWKKYDYKLLKILKNSTKLLWTDFSEIWKYTATERIVSSINISDIRPTIRYNSDPTKTLIQFSFHVCHFWFNRFSIEISLIPVTDWSIVDLSIYELNIDLDKRWIAWFLKMELKWGIWVNFEPMIFSFILKPYQT